MLVKVISDGALEHGHIDRAIGTGGADFLAKMTDRSGGIPSAPQAGNGWHARVVPSGDDILVNQLFQLALAGNGVAGIQSREFNLSRRVRHRQMLYKPVIQRSMIFKLQRTDGMRHAFNGVLLPVRKVIGGVNRPLITRLMMRRDVRERVRALAPFLQLRGAPYLVSVPLEESNQAFSPKQHQFWIVEGYTDSITFPYSSAVNSVDTDRYLRNSVKAVVDAYNGTVHLYVSEPDDPLIQGWGNVFPDLLEPLEAMPQQLRDHLRVPEDWFSVQVQQLQRYHVTDPRKFYSSDDVWQVPLETYGRDQVPVRPYHITAQVGNNSASEFLLLQPLTPLARPNLNAWLAARNDNEHYGDLLLIDFPRTSPILGPEQVQAWINQEPEISKQFGLWDRGGSEVLQGNLLVVPVGDALIYVEPVYLKASQGGLPSLARIVVSDGKEIAMAKTLDVAIAELQQKTPPAAKPAE